MAFDNIKTEINMLLARLVDHPHDTQEVEFLLHEKLRELRAFGMPLPDDLVELEAALDENLTRAGKGRARPQPPPRA